MIKRTLYQFDLVTGTDEARTEVAHLVDTLNALLGWAEVSWESAKTDIAVLRIEFDEEKP